MANTAKRRKSRQPEPGMLQRGVVGASLFVTDNPVLVGGATTFLVTLLYVSANALWYQPHAHTGPLFATRSFESFAAIERERAEPETTFQIERPEPEARRPLSDPAVERVQAALKDLNLYAGDVDGIKGPATERAIRAYQEKARLEQTGQIDQNLLDRLGAGETTGAINNAARANSTAADQDKAALVKKIQQGLRAFGSADIAIDGVPGARTRNAIKEFQSLFGLPEDGQPSVAVLNKMREAQFVK